MTKEYAGYPEIVCMSIPKTGNQTLNKFFSNLGYKVFGAKETTDFGSDFDDYGRGKVDFTTMAKKVWEDNKYDVIIEPSFLFWHEMAQHWPKTKFINTVRDEDGWFKSLKE